MNTIDQPTTMWSGRFREPLNRTLFLTIITAFVLNTSSSSAQQAPIPSASASSKVPAALVTFYSNSMSIEGGLPGLKGGAFRGRLFSDDDQIAFMEPGHFLTISFIPGHYSFSANAWAFKTPTGGAHLEIDLVADQHYFIETASRTIPFPSYFSIKQVPCVRAFKDNEHDAPLETKHLSTTATPFVVAETSFPKCP